MKKDESDPEILTPDEIERLLSAAKDYHGGALIPYVTIALFAAVRPNELAQLTWDKINLKDKELTISGGIAKMRRRRTVELETNLVCWLKPHAQKKGPVVPNNWRRHFDTIKGIAGFQFTKERVNVREIEMALPDLDWDNLPKGKMWVQDILRHTAISYHFAMHQHEGKTASWAGNSPDMIHRHYKGLVSSKDAAWFWKLKP